MFDRGASTWYRKRSSPRRRGRHSGLTSLTVLVWIAVFAAYGLFVATPSHFAAWRSYVPQPDRPQVSVYTPSPGGPGEAPLQLCRGRAQQSCVLDGDTIRYRGSTVRLADIDAPETREPQCASEAELGRRATLRLLDLVNAGPFEVVRSGGRDSDVYGRQLRRVERDGRSLGGVLVAEGLARQWDGARRSWCG